MKNEKVRIVDQYKELLLMLNEIIEKTVEIQKNTRGNSVEYRRTLGLQLEFEKTKLDFLTSLPDSFDTQICNEEQIGIAGDGRDVVGSKILKDVRFDIASSDIN